MSEENKSTNDIINSLLSGFGDWIDETTPIYYRGQREPTTTSIEKTTDNNVRQILNDLHDLPKTTPEQVEDIEFFECGAKTCVHGDENNICQHPDISHEKFKSKCVVSAETCSHYEQDKEKILENVIKILNEE